MARRRRYRLRVKLHMIGGLPKGWEDWLDKQLEELREMLTGSGEVVRSGKSEMDGMIWAESHVTADPFYIGEIVNEIEADFPDFHMPEPELIERRKH